MIRRLLPATAACAALGLAAVARDAPEPRSAAEIAQALGGGNTQAAPRQAEPEASVLAGVPGATGTADPLGVSVNALLDCSGCHVRPAEDRPRQYPNLVGQPVRYLAHQLEAYREGWRDHRQMAATATALGSGAPAMARIYGMLARPTVAAPDTARPEAEHPDGAAIARKGLWKKGVPPCSTCHGLGEAERARLAPYLHGQSERYLAAQLDAYAEGTRRSGPMGRMSAYAGQMTAGERAAVAAYYAAYDLEPANTEGGLAAARTGFAEDPSPAGDGSGSGGFGYGAAGGTEGDD